MLEIQSAPKKVHGATALTPSQWREHLAKLAGEYVVVGWKPGDECKSMAYSRPTAQWIFDELLADCDFATDGYRLRIERVS